jgi:hypothetical protein
MAKLSRKRKIVEDCPMVQKYYVHYDPTSNQIISVNNHRHDGYTHAVEVSFDQYDRLVTGRDKFNDFHIGVVIQSDGSAVNGLVSKKIIQEHNFKNRFLVWIDQEQDLADIYVHWDQFNEHWLFFVSEDFRQKYYDNKLPISTISFFVTLGKDPNFLLRSIEIDLKKLVEDKVVIKFESKWENNLDMISLTANLSSLRYSLKVWKLNEQDQSN